MLLKPVRVGILLAAAYVAVLVVTGVGHPVRPLYDGAGFSVPYRWVKAPWYVGSYNVKPKELVTVIPFEDGVSALTGVSSEDSQLILNLPKGAIPARAGATGVLASITSEAPFPFRRDEIAVSRAGVDPRVSAEPAMLANALASVTASKRARPFVTVIPWRPRAIATACEPPAASRETADR